MKKLKNLNGAKVLSKKEQQDIKGGAPSECGPLEPCNSGAICYNGLCFIIP